ncbi:MAG: class I SAM-dependent methyltransferase [Leptolyngbyaceae cyanobacterium]
MHGNLIDLFETLKEIGANQFGSFISSCQYLKAYNLTEKYFYPGSKILDWGTGNGHFSVFLASNGFDTTAFAIERESLSYAYLLRNFQESYSFCCDPSATTKIPFSNNTFEGVVSIGVLEHVREYGGSEIDSLSEIKRILAPGGYFLCYHFPNKFSWIEFLSQYIPGKNHHLYRYTGEDILRLSSEVDMDVIEISRYGLMPRLMFRDVPDTEFLAGIFNFLDAILEKFLSIFCQNYCFVLRKPVK